MNKSKKVTGLLLFCLMVVIFVSGCGKNIPSASDASATVKSSTATETSQKASTSETAGEAKKQELSGEIYLWSAWDDGAGPSAWAEGFAKLYPNVKVTPVYYKNTEEGNVKCETALLAGQQIDVVVSHETSRFIRRLDAGFFADITDNLSRSGIDILGNYPKEKYEKDGKFYGIPSTSVADYVAINKKIFDYAGVSLPDDDWTFEDFERIAKQLTKGEGADKIYGSTACRDKFYWAFPARCLLGADMWYNSEGKSNFDAPAFFTALDLKYRMEYVDKTQYPTLDLHAIQMTDGDMFLTGNIGMLLGNSSRIRQFKNLESYPRDFQITFRPFPNLKEGQERNYNHGMRVASYFSIAGTSKNKEAAWVFCKWITIDAAEQLASTGHIPAWPETDKDKILEYLIGDVQELGKWIDMDALKKYVLNYDVPQTLQTQFTAYDEVLTIAMEEAEAAMIGQKTIEEALASMKERADKAISSAK